MNGLELNSVKTTVNTLQSKKLVYQAANNSSLVFISFDVKIVPSFLDYLRGGWAISMVCAIDYTASNGNPSSPTSLHYLGPDNQYERAIYMVGGILEPYDLDKSFPVFGFGGIPRHMGINAVNHCFPLNGNPQSPEIFGIEQIVMQYRATLPNIGLGGPTLFAPLLSQFLQYVKGLGNSTVYNVMLLLTDGIINDMPETIRLIV